MSLYRRIRRTHQKHLRRMVRWKHFFHSIKNQFRWDGTQTRIITKSARFVTKSRTRATIHIRLNGPILVLRKPVKTHTRMRCPPHTNNGNLFARGEMHIGRIHSNHKVQRGYQIHFFGKRMTSSHANQVRKRLRPFVQILSSFATASKKKDLI